MLRNFWTTLLVSGLHYQWIIVGLFIGSAIGAVAAQRVQMTAMPEMVAHFNGAGGLASLLVGWVEYHNHRAQPLSAAIPSFSLSCSLLSSGCWESFRLAERICPL